MTGSAKCSVHPDVILNWSAIATTRTVLFQINVGCGTEPTHKYPVRLEYSVDGGNTWSLVVSNCAEGNLARCFDASFPATLYYGGTSSYWRRVIVPLDNLHLCG